MSRLLLLALLLPAAASALPEKTWVVAVGNNSGDAAEVGLLYAERDAREISEALRRLGGVHPRRVTLLLDADAETFRRTLGTVNAAIRAEPGKAPSALVVFYSGHADAASLHMGGTRFAFDELRTLVEGSAADLRLLVVDACRSGGVSRVKGVQAAPAFEIDLRAEVAAEGLAIITSSAAGESSQESDRLRASFFSHHLVNALRGAADRNGDQRVTLAEAYGYTYAQTLRSSGRTLKLQHPTYNYDVKGRGEVVLTQLNSADRRTGRLTLTDPSVYLISEEREGGPVVAEVSPPRAAAAIALPAARYFVQQRLPREFREYTVELPPGGVVDLAATPFQAVRYDRLVRQRGADTRAVHGLTLLAGARGEVLAGDGVAPQLVVGYGADLRWLSPGVRVRLATAQSDGVDGSTPRRHDELGLGLTLQRFIDLRDLSLAFGVLIEGTVHRQTFDTDRLAEDQLALGLAFGGLFSAERHLAGGLALRLEGGPLTLLFREGVIDREATVRTETATPLTWWGALGVVWRL